MDKVKSLNRDFALQENWALESTITYMIEKGYMDQDFNALKLSKEETTKLFEAYLANQLKKNNVKFYKPVETSFNGLTLFRKNVLTNEKKS